MCKYFFLAQRIHVSETAHAKLHTVPGYHTVERGYVDFKVSWWEDWTRG